MMRALFYLIPILLFPFLSWSAVGPGSMFTYEGILTDNTGAAITTQQTFTFQIIYSSSCIVYEETQSILPGSAGEFSAIIGTGERADTTGNSIDRIFASSGNVNCKGGSSVSILGFASRNLHIIIGSTALSPDVVIGNIPFAHNSQRLADKIPSHSNLPDTIVARDITGSFQAQNITANILTSNQILSRELQLSNGKNFNLIFKFDPNASANFNLTWPQSDGNSGQVLSTNGSGQLNWVNLPNPTPTSFTIGGDVSGDSTATQVDKIKGTPISSASPVAGQFLLHNGFQYTPQNLSGDASLASNGLLTLSTITVTKGGTGLTSGTTGGIPYFSSPNAMASSEAIGNSKLVCTNTSGIPQACANVTIDPFYIQMNSQKEIRFADVTSSQYVALRAPSTVNTSTTLTLPDSAGTSGQVLSTDGSGGLSWASNITATSTTLNGATTLSIPTKGHSLQNITLAASADIKFPAGSFVGQMAIITTCQNSTGGYTPTFSGTSGVTLRATYPAGWPTTTALQCDVCGWIYFSQNNWILTGCNLNE